MPKRLSFAHKRVLAKAVAAGYDSGHSVEGILAELNARGLKTATGLDWDYKNLTNFIGRARSMINRYRVDKTAIKTRKRRTFKVSDTAISKVQTGQISKNTVLSIITDPALNSDQMVAMLNAYVEKV